MDCRQHRILFRQYAKAAARLFLDPGSPSQLLVLRKHYLEPLATCRQRSSTSETESTFVNSPVLGQKEVRGSDKRRLSIQGHIAELPDSGTFAMVENDHQLEVHFREEATFRAFIIEQEHSYSCLDVSQSIFESLCTRLDAFPQFRDMVIYLGQRTCEVEVAPPRPRWRFLQHTKHQGFELTYGLRWIEENHRRSKWSMRQSVIFNKLDTENDASSWVIVAPTTAAREDLNDFIGREAFSRSDQQTMLHLAFIESSVICWRPYLVFLTEEIGKHVSLLNVQHGSANPEQIRDIKFANPQDAGRLGKDFVDLATNGARLELKTLEDQVTDSILALDANKDVIEAILNLLSTHGRASPAHANEDATVAREMFNEFLTEKIRDVSMLTKQLHSLQAKLTGCTHIASSFSELANGHTLQELVKAAQEETKQVTDLTRRAQRDGAAVKALTVITLIYLPTTVVLVGHTCSVFEYR